MTPEDNKKYLELKRRGIIDKDDKLRANGVNQGDKVAWTRPNSQNT